jgi:polar amino acid transport system substrate-binding protein
MRKPRFRVLLVGAAVLALLAAACNNNSSATPPASGGSTPGSTTSSPAGPAFSTLQPGVLLIGSCLDYAPFETVAPGAARPTGFDIELAEAIAAKLGFDQDHVEWVKANFNNIFSQQAQGRFDVVAAAVTATGKVGRQRAETVAFSDYYFNSAQAFTVNTTETPDLTSTDGLVSGDVVGVQQGTTGADWATTNLAPKGVEIKQYVGAPQAFTDLEGGGIAGVINDLPSSSAEVVNRPSLAVVQQIDTNEQYAFTFSKDNPELLAAWNGALAEVIADGTYSQIFEKYFPGIPVPPEYAAS